MKKLHKLLAFFVCIVLLIMPVSVCAEQQTSLTIHYAAGKCTFDFYKVADIQENGYVLASPFDEYTSTTSSLDNFEKLTADESRILASTLDALVARDAVTPVYTATTNENGELIWNGLNKGVYLIIGEKTQDETFIYSPAPIIISVSDENVVIEHTKLEKDELAKGTDYRVLKIWNDDDNKDNRPDFITIELLQNGKTYDTVILSDDNNWSYIWEDLPADYDWKAVEKAVPDGYEMAVEKEDNTFVIKNTYTEKPSTDTNLPNTGQLWWPVPVFAMLGAVLLVYGIIKRKNQCA